MLTPFSVKNKFRVVGCDVSYLRKNNLSIAAAVVMEIPQNKIIETSFSVIQTSFPYVPGLLAFREIPPVLNCLSNITSGVDILFAEGHGIAHPRRMGLASHLGLLLDIPTVGIAKKKLTGSFTMPSTERGSLTYLYDKENQVIGTVLRSRTKVKPIFVSPGHLTDFESSTEIVQKTVSKYKMPEPLRIAHNKTRKLSKKYKD